MSDLIAYINNQQWQELQQWYAEHDVLEIVDELYRLNSAELAIAFRMLSKDIALEVFESMDPPQQSSLISSLRDVQVRAAILILGSFKQRYITHHRKAQ